MTARRIIIFFSAVAVLITGAVTYFIISRGSDISPDEVTVISDGVKYRLSRNNRDDTLPGTVTEEPVYEELPTVGDRENLLQLLLDYGVLYDPDDPSLRNWGLVEESVMMAETPTDLSAQADSAGGAAGGSHSSTNEQVAGISEGDVVKTDGRYLYVLVSNSGKLRIISADGAVLEVASVIDIPTGGESEFYLIDDNRLVVISSYYSFMNIAPTRAADTDTSNKRTIADIVFPSEDTAYPSEIFSQTTQARIYDISNKRSPELVRTVMLEGGKVATRVIDSTLYMVTNKYIGFMPYDMAESRQILPFVSDSFVNDNDFYEPIEYSRIYITPDSTNANYLLVGALDIYGDDPFEPDAYLGAGSYFYMSHNAMYIANTQWRNTATWSSEPLREELFPLPSNTATDILRLAVRGTSVNYTGKGIAAGYPINQYSMDEYNGYFRIATTDWGTGTYVTVLDVSDMQTVGRTEAMAPGEQMRSMRFMGDMGYVVTFENTDPLFTVDLFDPQEPTVLGELKIPGFSQYLHPVGGGLMLGIGRDTEEIFRRDIDGNETVIGFTDVGMKVSLFDVRNPFEPLEVDVLRLGEGWAEVCSNPRALMADPVRGRYGFAFSDWDYDYDIRDSVSFIILGVENRKLTASSISSGTGDHYSNGRRLCYIGDYLYYTYSSGVAVYDYDTYEKIGNFVY